MIIKNNKFYLAPSLLSADFSCLKDTIAFLGKISIEIVHFDVMDNHFVPNLTFGHKLIKDLRKHSDLYFDTHLMIDSPENYIDNYIKSGCNNITFHLEASKEPKKLIQYIKRNNISCGISIKPDTPVENIEEVLYLIDLILVMTVEPGFGGQTLIKYTLPKIDQLKKIRDNNSYSYLIECDGGIGIDNVKELRNLGMDIAVMGSSFFNSNDKASFLKQIYDIISK